MLGNSILPKKAFFCVAGVSPLRRRPKGFPIALWKPSVHTPVCWLALEVFGGHASSHEPKVHRLNTRTLYESVTNSIARRVSRGSKTLRGCRAEPCRSPEAEPLAPPHSSLRPSIAFESVTSSAYSRSLPTGTPWAMRVHLMPMGLMSRAM